MMIMNLICAIVTLLLGLFVITAGYTLVKGNVHGMARVWLSEILNDIRGSVKNHVYSVWKGLNYIREKAVSISNPSSFFQQRIRAKTAATSKRWYATLTQGQRDLWNEYAEAMPPKEGDGGGTKQVIPDNRGTMSGFNAYVMINMLATSANVTGGDAFLDDAPIGIDAPNAPTGLACEWNGATCCIDLTWNDPIAVLVGSKIRVWFLSLDAGVHKQTLLGIALTLEAASICNVRVALGASTEIFNTPGHYHIQIDCVGPNGQKSPPSNVCQVTAPAACTPA
ncbi:hypothetical protein ES705_44987 [subsurface metagenome]